MSILKVFCFISLFYVVACQVENVNLNEEEDVSTIDSVELIFQSFDVYINPHDPNVSHAFVNHCHHVKIDDRLCRNLFQVWFVENDVSGKTYPEIYSIVKSIDSLLPNHKIPYKLTDIIRPIRFETAASLVEKEDIIVGSLYTLFHQHVPSETTKQQHEQRRISFIHSSYMELATTEILASLLDETISSGLIHSLSFQIILNFGLNLPEEFIDYYTNLYPNFVFVQVSNDITWGELPTIRTMHKFNTKLREQLSGENSQKIEKKSENIQFLYMHTKGVSHISPLPEIIFYTKLMLTQSVTEHRRNYHLLASGAYDIVGSLYVSSTINSTNHNNITSLPCIFKLSNYHGAYSSMITGNFWWATSNYLSEKLPPQYIPEDNNANYYLSETWLLDTKYDLPCCGVNSFESGNSEKKMQQQNSDVDSSVIAVISRSIGDVDAKVVRDDTLFSSFSTLTSEDTSGGCVICGSSDGSRGTMNQPRVYCPVCFDYNNEN